jgi:hypothetical protein
LPITSASREAWFGTSPLCSVTTALAVSVERLFSAALAPIANDTTPTKAAAMVTERREIRSCLTFITIIPVIVKGAQTFSRANAI